MREEYLTSATHVDSQHILSSLAIFLTNSFASRWDAR